MLDVSTWEVFAKNCFSSKFADHCAKVVGGIVVTAWISSLQSCQTDEGMRRKKITLIITNIWEKVASRDALGYCGHFKEQTSIENK